MLAGTLAVGKRGRENTNTSECKKLLELCLFPLAPGRKPIAWPGKRESSYRLATDHLCRAGTGGRRDDTVSRSAGAENIRAIALRDNIKITQRPGSRNFRASSHARAPLAARTAAPCSACAPKDRSEVGPEYV